jgi:hypothetical protein
MAILFQPSQEAVDAADVDVASRNAQSCLTHTQYELGKILFCRHRSDVYLPSVERLLIALDRQLRQIP